MIAFPAPTLKLRIARWGIELTGLNPALLPDNCRLFRDDSAEVEWHYHFRLVDRLPSLDEASWRSVYRQPNIEVYTGARGLEARYLSVDGQESRYALYRELSATDIEVFFLENLVSELKWDTVFWSCLSLERHLAGEGAYILHSAFLSYRGQAVLFSGPSEIGKSTHVDLWCRHVGHCHVVNGDRSLLTFGPDGKVTAHGWPVSGSSGICLNEHVPVAAIVFLEQRPRNALLPENRLSLTRRLTAQITINDWNASLTSRALDRMAQLQEQLPLHVYGCNLQPEAPLILRDILFPPNP